MSDIAQPTRSKPGRRQIIKPEEKKDYMNKKQRECYYRKKAYLELYHESSLVKSVERLIDIKKGEQWRQSKSYEALVTLLNDF